MQKKAPANQNPWGVIDQFSNANEMVKIVDAPFYQYIQVTLNLW